MSGSSALIGIDAASAYVDVAAINAELPAALSWVSNDADGHIALADGLAGAPEARNGDLRNGAGRCL